MNMKTPKFELKIEWSDDLLNPIATTRYYKIPSKYSLTSMALIDGYTFIRCVLFMNGKAQTSMLYDISDPFHYLTIYHENDKHVISDIGSDGFYGEIYDMLIED